MLTENLSSYSFFSGAAEKQVEGEWGKREEGQKQKEMKGKRPRSSSVYFCFLSFSPQRPYRQLSSPKYSGAGLILPGAGHSWSSQGENGCCLA